MTTNPNNFPAVTEGLIGSELVQTVNARDLHSFLECGEQFNHWIKQRIDQYGFIEGTDFVTFGEKTPKGRPRIEYAITLDMGKELGMVERSAKGKEVRRYFIACERKLKDVLALAGGSVTDITAEVRKVLGGMIKSNAGFVIREELDKMVSPMRRDLEDAAVRIKELEDRVHNPETCSALDIWEEFRLPPIKGGTTWLANRLSETGCMPEFGGRIKIGRKQHRRFDIAKSRTIMKAGLLLKAQRYVEERKGQGNLLTLITGGKSKP